MATEKENANRIALNLVDTSMSLEDAQEVTGIHITPELLALVMGIVYRCPTCLYWLYNDKVCEPCEQ